VIHKNILSDVALFIYKEFTLDLPNTQFSTIDEGYFLACAMGLQKDSGKYIHFAQTNHTLAEMKVQNIKHRDLET
jgi:hypothetical protein